MIFAKIIIDFLFFGLIAYFAYRFIQVLFKMRQPALFPVTEGDLASIRKHPTKPIDLPKLSNQKTGIFIYSGMLVFVMVMYSLGVADDGWSFPFYLLLVLPFSYSQDTLNLFAITEDGILSGVRFIPWKRVKSFEFVPIDMNHKYYGFSKEVNESAHELKITIKGITISCVVTSEETKNKLENVLNTQEKETVS